MNSKVSDILINSYRALGLAFYPFMGPFLRMRASRGKEERQRRYERYGYPSADRPSGPVVWFHAASVGESIAILPLVQHVNDLDISIILTTGTVTSAQMIRARLPSKCSHQYVPLDLKPALERFLDHWQPDIAIFTESEIWPMTLMSLSSRHIPRILVNARMSDRSYKRWKSTYGLSDALFGELSHVIAQSELDAGRFKSLGAWPVDISGNLKVDTGSLPYDEGELGRLTTAINGRPTWVAVSTHEGEEEACGNVHKQLKEKIPNLLTIIVPRHPNRANGITALLRENGLVTAQRSQNEKIKSETDVYMGDTIGEMGLYLRLAQVAFMGKSLASTGGQNPLEPAIVGVPIISGNEVHNFRDVYNNLLEKNAVRLVSDEAMLAANLEYLILSPHQRKTMIDAGMDTVSEMRGSLNITNDILDTYLFPLRLKREMESLKNGIG